MKSAVLLTAVLAGVQGAPNESPLNKWLNAPKYRLPEVNFNELVILDETASLQLTHDLTTIGAVQITNIPNFRVAWEEGLGDLASCLSKDDSNAVDVIMNDNTRRFSAGAASMHGVPTDMSSDCGSSASKLRSAVDTATRQLLLALDLSVSLRLQNPSVPATVDAGKLLDEKYKTFESIHANGEHLEHLHAYLQQADTHADDASKHQGNPTKADDIKSKSDSKSLYARSIDNGEMTMPMHTDSGLFIAMTSGYYKDSHGAGPLSRDVVENGLYIQLSTGSTVKAVTDEDSLVIMMGEGAAQWLAPALGQPLRAVPHAMTADVSAAGSPGSGSKAASRAWFGKMYLPPADSKTPAWEGRTYAQFREQASKDSRRAMNAGQTFVTTLPTACGSSLQGYSMSPTAAAPASTATTATKNINNSPYASYVYAQAQPTLSNALCDNGDGVYCWQQCYTGSDLPSCGTQAECVDSVTGEPVDGTEMCPSSAGMDACYLQCPGTNNTDTDEFCYGVGTSMFMSGFTTISSEDRGSTACMNLFFDHWTLNSKLKYVFACIGIFALAVFFEYLKVLKRQLMGLSLMKRSPVWVKDAVSVLFYGCQLTISYFLMLAAMTYSTELFSAMICGLTVGYALFTLKNPNKDSSPTCHDTGAEDDEGYSTIDTSTSKHDEFGKQQKQQEEGNCCTSDVQNRSTTTAPLHENLVHNSHLA